MEREIEGEAGCLTHVNNGIIKVSGNPALNKMDGINN
jgi:hypothetical protein